MSRTEVLQRILKLACLMAALVVTGTLGYCHIENWPASDSMYMTVITISTVGFGETQTLSPEGRAFTSCLIIASIVGMACCTATITSVVVEGNINGIFVKRRMNRMASRMKDHVIICGSGVFARSILELLYGGRHAIVVLCDDASQAEVIRSRYPNVPVIEQSPTDELALAQANLATAEYVVAATLSDIDNLLISMTCKHLNPRLNVYTFSLDGNHASRMTKLGVEEVVCPHLLSGSRIAKLIERNEEKKTREPLLAERLTY